MNCQVQRLFRAQRLLLRAARLPQVTRRFTSTQTPLIPQNITPPAKTHKVVEILETQPKAAEVLEVGGAGKEDSEATTVKPDPPLYWALSELYVAGCHIQRAEGLETADEKSIPKWTKNGITLRTKSNKSTTLQQLPHFWLRDNCRCSKCVNQDTMQRALDTFSIERDIVPSEVITEKEGLRIKWSGEDGHVSLYPWDWLMKFRPDLTTTPSGQKQTPKKSSYTLWDASIAANPPSVHYDEVMADDKGVAAWTAKIREFGFCYVDDCPVSPEKTKELLERISFIRMTHYGGFYDFTADLNMKDTAYTNLALPAHTDNTYFTDPSGLQAFHLLSHTDGKGGESLLVDGFHAAEKLKDTNALDFNRLSWWSIPWHASGNAGITIKPFKNFPVFEFGDLIKGQAPELMRIRWNNDDRGVVPLVGEQGMTAIKWYNAARSWKRILDQQDMQYWAQLKPGRPLIFDNWRVLHGRSAFTGTRRICGGYLNHDDYISRWRNTNFTREEALNQIL